MFSWGLNNILTLRNPAQDASIRIEMHALGAAKSSGAARLHLSTMHTPNSHTTVNFEQRKTEKGADGRKYGLNMIKYD